MVWLYGRTVGRARGDEAAPVSRRAMGALLSSAAMVLAVVGLTGLGAAPALAQQTATRTSSFTYDPTTGLLTSETVEPANSQLTLTTTYTYDAYGNKTSATVSSPATGSAAIESRTSTTTYDSQGRFVTSATNALGQSETRVYEPNYGHLTSLTGPNGLTTQWQYDSFGRKTLEIRSDGTQTSYQYVYCSGVAGGTAACPQYGAYYVQTTPLASDGATQNGPYTITYYDVLNRAIETDSQGFDGTGTAQVIKVSTVYNALGQVQQKSRPYFTGATPEWVTYTYDAIGRVSTETFPDNSQTTYAYNGLTSTVTNSLGQTRTKVKNSQGQVVQAIDTSTSSTDFTYDPFGNVLTTTDAVGNVTSFQYDTRGRKIQMTDPDMGTWSYVYDALGELVQQTDAKGQVTTFAYDLLGRPINRTEADLTSTWTYDTQPYGVGKLATAGANNGYSRTESYDTQGRPAQVALTLDGQTSGTVAESYDANGHISTVTYPSGFAVQYQYTALGYLQQVNNAATSAMLWQANTMDAELHLTQSTAGNNVETLQTYDPATERLTGTAAWSTNGSQSAPDVQNASYMSIGVEL